MSEQLELLTNIPDDLTVERPEARFVHETLQTLFENGNPGGLWRLDGQGNRYYYRIDDEIQWYISVTSLLNMVLPTGYGLTRWRGEMGNDKADEIMRESAAYGTVMHKLWAEYLLNGFISLKHDDLVMWFADENVSDEWVANARDDLLAFAQWVNDYQVKPLAVELMVYNPVGYAGAVDLVAEITDTVGRGKTKERVKKTVIVDFKSGRKGFYESHALQLNAYREALGTMFPEVSIDDIYNWSPAGWVKEPKYHFKCQSDNKELYKWPYLSTMYLVAGQPENRMPSPIKYYGDDIGEDLTEACKILEPNEFVKLIHGLE